MQLYWSVCSVSVSMVGFSHYIKHDYLRHTCSQTKCSPKSKASFSDVSNAKENIPQRKKRSIYVLQ